MLVSIIIPCYNNEAYVVKTIKSALHQSYEHIEIIVIDDGSTDGSPNLIRQFNSQIIFIQQSNQGAPAARNAALKIAKGTYIKFLDADDILLPRTIEQQVGHFKKLPTDEKAIVYGPVQWIDKNDHPTLTYQPRPRQAQEEKVAHILSQNPLTSAPLHHRKYLEEIGGFDIKIPKGQEFDLHLRLVLNGVTFYYFPETVYLFREHYTASRISHLNFKKYQPDIFYKIFEKQERLIKTHFSEILPDSVKAILAKRYWNYGRKILQSGKKEAARIYFKKARLLSGRKAVTGNFPYPQLNHFFGPIIAEKWMSRLRAMR